MNKQQVVIAIFLDHIDMVVYEGSQRIDSGRVPIVAPDQDDQWVQSVRDSAEVLRALAKQLGVVDASATVLYRSPTQSVNLTSLAGCSASEVIEAGKLGCLDTLSYPVAYAVCKATTIARKADSRRHAIAVAEHEETTQAITDLIEEAQLKLESITPLDAAVTHHLVTSALGSRQENRGWLYIGEDTSFFMIVSNGTLKFSRQIRLGCESFARALTRPIYTQGSTDPIELDIEIGRKIFYDVGFPDPDQAVYESPAITGRQILPLLQPLSQRLIVELRQSLRFGLDESGRDALNIFITGPGSKLPGVADFVGDKLSVKVSCDPSYGSYDWTVPGDQPSELSDALESRSIFASLNLLPPKLLQQRQTSQFRRWLWVGAAAGLALIAFDSLGYHFSLVKLRKQAQTYEPQIANIKKIKSASEQLSGSLEEMKQLEQAIDEQVGWRFDLWAYMQELSRITPATVRFTTMNFQRQGKNVHGTLSGYARVTAGRDETDLEACIARLRSSLLFEKIVLDHVELDSAGSGADQRFTIKLMTMSVPRSAEAVQLAIGKEGQDTP